MTGKRRRPAARSARTGGASDLAAGDPNDVKRDLKRAEPHPQGAGGLDVAKDVKPSAKKRAKRRLSRVLR